MLYLWILICEGKGGRSVSGSQLRQICDDGATCAYAATIPGRLPLEAQQPAGGWWRNSVCRWLPAGDWRGPGCSCCRNSCLLWHPTRSTATRRGRRRSRAKGEAAGSFISVRNGRSAIEAVCGGPARKSTPSRLTMAEHQWSVVSSP